MPPNLDIRPDAPEAAHATSLEKLLNVVAGAACLTDSGGNVRALSAGWDEFFSRAPGLHFEAKRLADRTLGSDLADGALGQALESAHAAVAGGQDQFSVMLELGTATKPFAVTFVFRRLERDGAFEGCFVQVLDSTSELISRHAALSRERKLRELRTVIAQQAEQIAKLQAQLAEERSRASDGSSRPEEETPRNHLTEARAHEGGSERRGGESKPIRHNTGEDFRILAAGLAEEFGNLLTGVLGRASLLEAEVRRDFARLADVRAVEEAARRAAQVTRKLSALCGNLRRPDTVSDFTSFLPRYLTDQRSKLLSGRPIPMLLPDAPAAVPAENSVLEIILDGMIEHALQATAEGQELRWTLTAETERVVLVLSYEGAVMPPSGWEELRSCPPARGAIAGLLFSREAARALGGEIELRQEEGIAKVVLALPRVVLHAEAETRE